MSAQATTRDVRNDRKAGVTKFCLAMEEHRRTEAGRVRNAREMVDFYFPRTGAGPEDRIFLHIPPEVRGPIIAGWGVRGAKSALRDTDEKVKQVVADALAAGDIDETSFEDGLDPQTLIDWAPLQEWWQFWRTGKLTGVAIQKALAVARELALFDDRWFLLNVEGRGGKLKGTDTLCDTLSKDQIIAWMRRVHESGDGSPAGLVAALGWDTVLTKTAQEALLFSLDAFAKKVGLVTATSAVQSLEPPAASQSDSQDVSVPELPAADADDREEPNAWSGSSSAPAGAAAQDGAPAQSGSMLTTDEAPISFQDIGGDQATEGTPRAPVPPSRKAR